MVLLGAGVAKEAFWVYVTIVKPIVHLISSDSTAIVSIYGQKFFQQCFKMH